MIILLFSVLFVLIALLSVCYALLAVKKKETFLWAAGSVNLIIFIGVFVLCIANKMNIGTINPFPFFLFALAELILFAITCFVFYATRSKENPKRYIFTGIVSLILVACLIVLPYIDMSGLANSSDVNTYETETTEESTTTDGNDYSEEYTTEPETEPVTEPYIEPETEKETEAETTTRRITTTVPITTRKPTTTKVTTTRPTTTKKPTTTRRVTTTTRPTTTQEPTTEYNYPEQIYYGSEYVMLDLSTDNEFVFYPSSSGYYAFYSECDSYDLMATASTLYTSASNDDYSGTDFLIVIYCYEDEPVNLSVRKFSYIDGYTNAYLNVYDVNISDSEARARYTEYLIEGIEITSSDTVYYSPDWSSTTATFNETAIRYPVDYYYDLLNDELWIALDATKQDEEMLVWYPC